MVFIHRAETTEQNQELWGHDITHELRITIQKNLFPCRFNGITDGFNLRHIMDKRFTLEGIKKKHPEQFTHGASASFLNVPWRISQPA